jgi:hypothetical protein
VGPAIPGWALRISLDSARRTFRIGPLFNANHNGPEADPSGPSLFDAFSRSPRKNAPRPTPLAGTQGRTRRSWSRTESHSRHQRRRHVPQRFSASRAMVGADSLGPHPIPLHFTLWIDTLHGGARHNGHSELPQRPPTHPVEVSSPWRPEIRGTDRADPQIFAPRTWGCQRKTTPTPCGSDKSVEKPSTFEQACARL